MVNFYLGGSQGTVHTAALRLAQGGLVYNLSLDFIVVFTVRNPGK